MVDASTGSSDTVGGLGACLVQYDEADEPRPIAYASRSLLKHEQNYSAYLAELAACVFGITHFDVYLRGKHFFLCTDHKPLEKLSSVHTKTFNRLQQLMLDYNFTIMHKPGKDNAAPDFLSETQSAAFQYPSIHWSNIKRRIRVYKRTPNEIPNCFASIMV